MKSYKGNKVMSVVQNLFEWTTYLVDLRVRFIVATSIVKHKLKI